MSRRARVLRERFHERVAGASMIVVFAMMCAGCKLGDVTATSSVNVYQDATTKAFAPFSFGVHSGDTVVWHFPTASPGNAVARRVYVRAIPNSYTPGWYAIAPYTPTYANELVGPMIEAPSGIFALGPPGYGMVEQSTPCSPPASRIATRSVGMTTEYPTASALEIYEERLWEANHASLGGVANPTRTIGDWNTELHARRLSAYPALGDPAPLTYTFTFGTPVVKPLPPRNNYEYNAYVDPRLQPVTQAGGCVDGFSPCVVVYP